MSDPVLAMPNPSETAINLLKDGGRRVMYGGDPYEDDVERDSPASVATDEPRYTQIIAVELSVFICVYLWLILARDRLRMHPRLSVRPSGRLCCFFVADPN